VGIESLTINNIVKKGKMDFPLRTEGLCPKCGKAPMFRAWLKLQTKCPLCALNYNFAAPDDGPAFSPLHRRIPTLIFRGLAQVTFDPPFGCIS
jgi:uncharacterized protein (DUF983 family)